MKLPGNYDKWKTSEPEVEEFVIAKDWRGYAIYNWEGDMYYLTDEGWVREDEAELYMEHIWGRKRTPDEF